MSLSELIKSTIQEDAITLGILLLILGSLMFLNILLGSVTSWCWGEWKTKKFWIGVVKAVLVGIAMMVFMFILEIFPIALERKGIIIPKDLITTLEIISLVVVASTKYIKDIFNRFKEILGNTDHKIENNTTAIENNDSTEVN